MSLYAGSWRRFPRKRVFWSQKVAIAVCFPNLVGKLESYSDTSFYSLTLNADLLKRYSKELTVH